MVKFSEPTTKKPAVPRTNTKPSSKALSSSTFKGKSAYEANAQRTFLIHMERLQNAQPSGPFMDPPRDLSFLESKVSKNYSNERRGKVVLRENLQLLKRLATIQSESVENRLQKYITRNVGPPIHSVRYNVRMRAQDEIGRENLRLLRRLQTVESEYTLSKFKRERKNIVRLMKMRRQDHTRGHLFATGAGPISVGSHAKFEHLTQMDAEVEAERSSMRRTLPPRFEHEDYSQSSPVFFGAVRKAPGSGSPGSIKSRLPPLERKSKQSSKTAQGSKVKDQSRKGSKDRKPSSDSFDDDEPVPERKERFKPRPKTSEEVCIHSCDKSFVVAMKEGVRTLQCVISVWIAHPFTQESMLRYSLKGEDNRQLARTRISIHDARKMIAEWDKLEAQDEDQTENDENETKEMYKLLSEMFLEADEDHSGSLDREEFFYVLRDADLGISGPGLQMVLSEADEDADGRINYLEFLPTAIDLVQSFKARQIAQRKQDKLEIEVSDEALKLLYSAEIDQAIDKLMSTMKEVDVADVGVMSRTEFKNCLKKSAMELTRLEINMVLSQIPHDANNRIKYLEFPDVMYQVRFTTIKNSIMETRASDTEKLLMNLCKGEELKKIQQSDISFSADDPPFTGLITTLQLSNVLMNVKLSLNRLQVTSIMCEAEVQDGMVDYWKFVPVGAKAIDRMNDPKSIQQKARLMQTEPISPEDFLKGKNEEELRDQLMEVFNHYDEDNSGELDKSEFEQCLMSLDLGLTSGQINALMIVADTDHTGLIDRDEFMSFGFQHLVHLQREKHMKQIQNSLDARNTESHITDEAMFRSMFDPTSEDSMKAIEKDLINIFTRADIDGNGYLCSNGFRDVIMAMDLGMSPYQVAVLMTEADVNGDGKIQYSEFVPVGLKMLCSYKAKAGSLRKWRAREKQAEEKAEGLMHSLQGQLDSCVHELELAFHAADESGGLKLLPRETFVKCLNDPRGGLSRNEIKKVLARIPSGPDGVTSYKNVRIVMQEVRRLTVKRQMLAELPRHTLEKHLIQLFDEKVEDSDELELGLLNPLHILEVMEHASYLNLTRQQLMAVMSLQKPCAATDGGEDEDDTSTLRHTTSMSSTANIVHTDSISSLLQHDHEVTDPIIPHSAMHEAGPQEKNGVVLEDIKVDYWKFASCAAEMISKFFDVQELERRAKLLSSAKTSPINVLGGLQQDELERRLLSEFRQVDKRRTGLMEEREFIECIKPIRQLRLEETDLLDLAFDAPHDTNGLIQWKKWMEHAFETILNFAQNKTEDGSGEKSTVGGSSIGVKQADGISQQMVQSIAEKLVGLVELRSKPQVEKTRYGKSRTVFEVGFRTPSDRSQGDAATLVRAKFKDSPEKPLSRRETRRMSKLIADHERATGVDHLIYSGTGKLTTPGGEDGSNPDTIFKVARRCGVVDEEFNPVRERSRVPGGVGEQRTCLTCVEIRANNDKPHFVTIAVFLVDEATELSSTLRLPTLAMVDLDTAIQWAKQISMKIEVIERPGSPRSMRIADQGRK